MLHPSDQTPPPTRTNDQTSLVKRFEQIFSLHPHTIAVTCGPAQLTYAELNTQANRIAHRLLALELPQGSIVAIWLDRTNEAVAAILGVLKAGHAYLPLEATYPTARIAETLEDAQPAVLISQRSLTAVLATSTPHLILLDDETASADENPNISIDAAARAYIIYTSGSTGKPKGVMVKHSNVTRLVDQAQRRLGFDHNDVWTLFHSFAFDFSVWEMFCALLTGARLVVVPFDITRSPEDFYTLLSREKITVLGQTPSAFALLDQIEERGPLLPLHLRLVILAGEALQFSRLSGWFARHPDTSPQFINGYGPTETTVGVTLRKITPADALSETDSLIGQPFDDLQVNLLDAENNLVPDGATGEICVGGAGVSLGYLNRPDLTAERFVANPFGEAGSIMYRTGDLARRRHDGELVYMGRSDQQVKINGFRIELGEVEALIAAVPGIAAVCVVPHTDDSGRAHLAAYFVEDGTVALAIPHLALQLARKLPAQMLPTFYTRIDAIPLSSSGKIDRKALPAPSRGTLLAEDGSRETSSDLEEAVLNLVRSTVGTQEITLADNFFTAGGHSLLGTRFVRRARETFGVKLNLRDVFETENIAELAARIETLILEEIHALSEDEAARLATEQPA